MFEHMEANFDRDVDRSKWGRGLLRSPTGWETGESARRFHGRGLERKVVLLPRFWAIIVGVDRPGCR